MKYRVNFEKRLFASVEVEADNEDAAVDAAYDSEDMPGSLCIQCSGYADWDTSVDEGEWDLCEDKPVTVVEERTST